MHKFIFTIVCVLLSYLLQGQQTMGLFFNESKSYNGYTLFSNNETSYLIDNCGFVVNTWESEFKCDNGLFITPSGKLVRHGRLPTAFSSGGAGGMLEQFSWNGVLEWQFQLGNENLHAHHDIELLPNGNILVLVWEKISEQEALQAGRIFPGQLWSECIYELEPLPNNEAKLVWKWSMMDHLIQEFDPNKDNFGLVKGHPELLHLNYLPTGFEIEPDWLHINSIDYHVALDQIAICSRNNSEIYVLDHSTTTLEAAGHEGGKYGRGGDILYRYGNKQAYDHGIEEDQLLNRPHDISWVSKDASDADFLIFNNEYLPNNRSRIEIWNNPGDNGFYNHSSEFGFGIEDLIWSYDEAGFYSSILSSVQKLPNGNILALEGFSGEISELTPEKEKVWKYINPVNRNGGPGIQSGTPQFNSLFQVKRYPIDYPGFENQNLSPVSPVELSPDQSDCLIHENPNTVVLNVEKKLITIELGYKQLFINNLQPKSAIIHLINYQGQRLKSFKLPAGKSSPKLPQLLAGIYLVLDKDGQVINKFFIAD